MDRRGFVTAAVGTLALGGEAAAAGGSEGMRPSFEISPDGPVAWRVRSWEMRAGAWTPLIARLALVEGDFVLTGRVDPADHGRLADWIASQR